MRLSIVVAVAAIVSAAGAGVSTGSAGPADAVSLSARGAADMPDTHAVRLDLLAHRPRSVRVACDFGTRILEGPWADGDGLHYRATPPLRPAVIVGAEAAGHALPPLPNPIPWSSLERIERPQFRVGQGPILGAVLGAAAGYGLHRAVQKGSAEDWSGLFIPGGLLAGIAAGAMATVGDRWVEVPPVPSVAAGRR